MSFDHSRRAERLAPNGIPRWIRCYDNGGMDAENGSADRYTVCFTGKAGAERSPGRETEYSYRAMSAAPFHPQGVGMWGASKGKPCDVNKWGFAPAVGRKCHVGRRINFTDLPADCQQLAKQDYAEIWGIGKAGQ